MNTTRNSPESTRNIPGKTTRNSGFPYGDGWNRSGFPLSIPHSGELSRDFLPLCSGKRENNTTLGESRSRLWSIAASRVNSPACFLGREHGHENWYEECRSKAIGSATIRQGSRRNDGLEPVESNTRNGWQPTMRSTKNCKNRAMPPQPTLLIVSQETPKRTQIQWHVGRHTRVCATARGMLRGSALGTPVPPTPPHPHPNALGNLAAGRRKRQVPKGGA